MALLAKYFQYVKASDRCTGGNGFYSPAGSIFKFVPCLCQDEISFFFISIAELRIYHLAFFNNIWRYL